MTEKVNYYKELKLDENASSEDLKQVLKVIIEKWFKISNTSKQEERIEAEYIIKIAEEAIEILGNPDKKEEYDRVISTLHENDLSEYEHIYNKAQEFKDLGKLNETMTLAKQLLDMNPNDWRGWEIAGRVYHDDNKTEIALNYYEKAIELEKNLPAYVYCNLGIVQKVLGKYVEAFGNFQCSLDISYNFDRSLKECSQLLQYMDTDSVLPFFELLKEKRNDSLAYETLAKVYVLKAEGLVQIKDGTPSFISEEQKKEYNALIKSAKDLSGKSGYDKKTSEAEQVLVETEYERICKKANDYKDSGDLNKTLTLAKQLMDMNPNDWRGWEIAGRVYHDDNNVELAQNHYEKAIELGKNIPAYVHSNLGVVQKVLGNYVEAYRNFQRSLVISPKYNRPLEECKKLLKYVDIDSVFPFLESLKEKRNDELVYETLSTAYFLKAEELVQVVDGKPCFTSEEQIQEYKKRLKKAASYGKVPDLDKKIAEADSMLEKTLDRQKIPVLLVALLHILTYIYAIHTLITPLTLVIFAVVAYKSYRPKYEINRLKVGTASFYDELVDKIYIKDSKAVTIIIWFMFFNILVIPYIGIPVYSILTVYIIFSSIYTGLIDKKFKFKLNSEDNDGLIFNGEIESERRRRIRKIEWSRWWDKWGPTVLKGAKIIGIIALVIIGAYILFWIAIIAIALMLLVADAKETSSNLEKRDPMEEARLRNKEERERQIQITLYEEEQERRYGRRR